MLYIQRYRSPLGEILMAADDAGLVCVGNLLKIEDANLER